ncbi:urease accessory protein UreF [Streptomyces sp. NPDC056323]|uniref:urease accessory protein UreF n=1 Tax=unclassified Streptomyces TaxID=2593676 RepID=UPI0035D869F7
MSRTALLLLADGRFPAGGYAHSGGVEAAVVHRAVHDIDSLEAFCRGRLHTTGLTTAGLAAAAAAGVDPLLLDDAADARTPVPALRAVARKLGRQMMRAARATFPSDALDGLATERPQGAHQPIVLGLAARAAALTPMDAACAAAYESTGGPATAAVRLLSLDPLDASRLLARLSTETDTVAKAAADAASRVAREGLDALPSASSPLLDITGQQHAAWTMRLFAS